KPGDSVIAPKVMYWALRKWLQTFGVDSGLDVRFVDTTNLNELRDAIAERQPTLIWLETPGNPLWTVTDITAVADIARNCRALLAVDST
ncbi:PLP-dependent transferase, partial [Burkholderia sp. SIMBA_057]